MDLKKSRVANKSYEALLHLFNLCIEHGGLEFEDKRKVKCKNTPAKECGITESTWTLKDLLTFKSLKTLIT
ncbi:hypothetical protein BGV40_11990 [Methanosarcina sp. Ant1]|nr:hypothetical protein BGV40_11990 [Methanosarcina sp. Ant1]